MIDFRRWSTISSTCKADGEDKMAAGLFSFIFKLKFAHASYA